MELIESFLRRIAPSEVPSTDLNVADVRFSYRNSWVVDILSERGDAIVQRDWDRFNRINQELTDKMVKNVKTVVTPVSAFVVFENEVAIQLMLAKKLTLFGERVEVKKAPEPTNIIWEHQDFTAR